MLLRIFFCLYLGMMVHTIFAQELIIVSKEEALIKIQTTLPDSTRQQYYNFLGGLFLTMSAHRDKGADSAIYYLRKAVYTRDSANATNNELTNESLCLLAQAYLERGDVVAGKKIFDQVLSNYHQQQEKKKEALTLRRMGRILWNTNLEFSYAMECFDKAILLNQQANDILAKAEVMIDKINFYTGLSQVQQADKELQLLLQEARLHEAKFLPDIYMMLAKEGRYEGNLNKALAYALEAVRVGDSTREKKAMHTIYGELAQIYEELGEPEKSVYWYQQCIEQREKLNLPQFILYRTTSLMVNQMIKIGRASEAIGMLRHLEKRNPPSGHIEKASLAQSFAYCYSASGLNILAERNFLEMIKQFNSGETHKEFLSIAYFDIGQFYVNLHQFAKAGPYLKKAVEFAQGTSVLSRQKNLFLLLFKVDSANGNLASAITNFQHYKLLNDSIFNIVKSQQISDLMIKYETAKKDINIQSLEKEGKLQQVKLVQANQTRNWMLGAALLLLIITGLLVNNARIKQRNNQQLKIQQAEIQHANNTLKSLVKEKDWLVKEIHHRVKNNFHMVMGLLGTQSGYLKSEEAIEAMKESQHRVHAMSLIHQKLYQSDNLSAINITDYIHELVDYLRDSFSIQKLIQFKLDIDPVELDLSHCLPLGLILNEAITNSIKYAFPETKDGIITISFKSERTNNYTLTIRDNGIGLPAGFTTSKTGAMGLNLMQGLSDDIDGVFKIFNKGGTTIQLDFIYTRDTNSI